MTDKIIVSKKEFADLIRSSEKVKYWTSLSDNLGVADFIEGWVQLEELSDDQIIEAYESKRED